MPKRQAQRIIDNRSANRNPTTISGVTLSAPATGVSDHGLLLGLGDDGHPQYLLADGTRTLAGNLAVGTGVTVDGVDISAHAADPAAHHAPVTAGTLIGLSGQQVSVAAGAAYQFIGTGGDTVPEWRNVSELAGNGMTATNGVLAVGVANTGAVGLSVEADAVRLTSSSNPGAAASILASDANGYLRLVRIGLGMAPTKPLSVSGDAGISGNVAAGSLSVTGAATVGQDFTVGANVLYVNQAGTRVGINRAPDQQFDLDVAGAIRGQYLIGKHAIQLSSAVGVWHYDGPAPYNLDFGGSDASHAGIGGTPSGGVIYQPGAFGKAVQVAQATTNYFIDPSCEYDATLSQWSKYAGSGTLTGARSTEVESLFGSYTAKVVGSVSASGLFYQGLTLPAGGAMVSCYVRQADGAAVTSADCSIYCAGADVTTTYTEIGGGWYRLTGAGTSSGGTQNYGLRVPTGVTVYADGFQAESKAFATPYCDGSLGTGHSWAGTAHASTSSRTAAVLSYSLPTIRGVGGLTAMGWFNLQGTIPHDYGYLWYTANDGYSAYYNATALIVGGVNCGAPPSGWFHVALTTAGDAVVEAFINGVSVGTASISRANLSAWWVGGQSGGNQLEGLIDEFVVTDWEADAKLIRAIYESDAPVFVESSVFHWRSPSASPIWVDEYGLWARSVTGNEILGVYGGDPRRVATYRSWGGVNLEDNDVLIGRAAGGYMHWDDSAQTLSVQGTITALAGSIAGVLTIGTSGEIRQGTGTLGTDYTGLRMWRDSGIGRIGGYANNTLQWYAGTDGKLYAGGGNVTLDSSGLSLIMWASSEFEASGAISWKRSGHDDLSFYATLSPYGFTFRYPTTQSEWDTALKIYHSGTIYRVWHELNDGAGSGLNADLLDGNHAAAFALLSGATFTGALGMSEMTAPSAPPSNGAYIYLDDNGSGKTRLMVRFSSGSAVQLAIQP